jgi:hypothetical protein
MAGSRKYIELAVVGGRQGLSSSLGVGRGVKPDHHKITRILQNISQGLGLRLNSVTVDFEHRIEPSGNYLIC